MTALSIIEVFAATGAALGTWKGGEWIIKRFFPTKKEKRQDEASTKQAEIDVEKAMRGMFEEERKELRADYSAQIKSQREDYEARIKDLHEANSYLNNQITELLKAGARKDEIIADKVTKIRELEELRVNDAKQHAKEIAVYDKRVTYYKNWFCEREQGRGDGKCMRRKPMQNPPLKYTPIKTELVECENVSTLIVGKE